jgi:hypothetical protein
MVHRRTAPTPVHRTTTFLQLQKLVKAVMCVGCCLVWVVMSGEPTFAMLSQNRVARKDCKLCLRHQRLKSRCCILSISSDMRAKLAAS